MGDKETIPLRVGKETITSKETVGTTSSMVEKETISSTEERGMTAYQENQVATS